MKDFNGGLFMQSKYMTIIVISLIVCACAGARATQEVGRKFDVDRAPEILVGKTTEAEVVAMLGNPIRVKTLEDGTKKVLYGYAKKQQQAVAASAGVVTGAEAKSGIEVAKVLISYDKKGVVKDVEWTNLPGQK
jgi:hypothetical protein